MGVNQLAGKIVLIADDEEYLRHHLARKMADFGLVVHQAGTGEEVIRLAELQPDLIIMDVKMPVLDGLETVKRLKSLERTASIPVLLLSAMAQEDKVAVALAVGAVEYVVKPITFDRLMDSVRTHLKAKVV